MKDRYTHLRTAIESFGARFALVNPSASPIPVEAPIEVVIRELHRHLKEGHPLHPPREVIKGQGDFAGYELMVSEPLPPNGQGKTLLCVSIYTDLNEKTVLTDQRVIAHGIIGLVIAEWLEGVEAEQKAKAEADAKAAEAAKPKEGEDSKVTKFPGAESAAPAQ
jgi:hypothetical protein